MLFSSRVRFRIRVRIRFSVWLVSFYAHVLVLLSIAIVKLPLLSAKYSVLLKHNHGRNDLNYYYLKTCFLTITNSRTKSCILPREEMNTRDATRAGKIRRILTDIKRKV